ncbi:MAG: hypothetical protein B7Y95_14710 [Rhizobiales bacterium 32-66-11]|nr:MAG: hypothetical protein B7Y95_14710 [Rhizobiales bacterium 32-66-11]
MTHAPSWSEDLKALTRAAVEDLDVTPRGDGVYFKHIRAGFGIISFGDLVSGRLKLRDTDTGDVTTFADADALIEAGWVID